jgi:hypothetical protein
MEFAGVTLSDVPGTEIQTWLKKHLLQLPDLKTEYSVSVSS